MRSCIKLLKFLNIATKHPSFSKQTYTKFIPTERVIDILKNRGELVFEPVHYRTVLAVNNT